MKEILKKIDNKDIKIGIIGLGYVGLPLAMTYVKKGFKVCGYDSDKIKINKLNNSQNYILDVDSELLFKSIRNNLFIPTSNEKLLKQTDVIFICVPTPITKHGVPDTSYISSATETIKNNMSNGKIIILRSTSYPGTTEEIIYNYLERNNFSIDKDYYLSFSPERIDPGNKKWNSDNTPIVVGGMTKDSGKISKYILKAAVPKVYSVSNPKVAEMEKLLENIYRSVNIALVNELAQMSDKIGDINIWEAIDAASTKPFGYMPFRPGPGIGGHCILVDPYYLSYCARGYDFHSEFIQLAAKTNENMPQYITNRIIGFLTKCSVDIKNAKFIFLGVSFKKNVNDIRNSPAIKIIKLLNKLEISNIGYSDPFVSNININNVILNSESISIKNLKETDCVILTTEHDKYNYQQIAEYSNIIIDTRNAFKDLDIKGNYLLIGSGSNGN